MAEIWQSLWNAGIPLFLLVVGIVVVWRQWRLDMAEASRQRDEMVQAVNALATKIDALKQPTS